MLGFHFGMTGASDEEVQSADDMKLEEELCVSSRI